MREQINDQELEQVVGGIVRINGNIKGIGFTTLGQAYHYTCSYSQAVSLAATLYEQYQNRSQADYEQAVLDAMRFNGWISEG